MNEDSPKKNKGFSPRIKALIVLITGLSVLAVAVFVAGYNSTIDSRPATVMHVLPSAKSSVDKQAPKPSQEASSPVKRRIKQSPPYPIASTRVQYPEPTQRYQQAWTPSASATPTASKTKARKSPKPPASATPTPTPTPTVSEPETEPTDDLPDGDGSEPPPDDFEDDPRHRDPCDGLICIEIDR